MSLEIFHLPFYQSDHESGTDTIFYFLNEITSMENITKGRIESVSVEIFTPSKIKN